MFVADLQADLPQLHALSRNHTFTGFWLLFFSSDYMQFRFSYSQVDSQVSQLIWGEQKWQQLNHVERSSANNQVWLNKGRAGSGVFLAPFLDNWQIWKKGAFQRISAGSRVIKLTMGKPKQELLCKCQCWLTLTGEGTWTLWRSKENSISHRETEKTTELIQISYLGEFLSL